MTRLLPATATELSAQKANLEAGAKLLGNVVAEDKANATETDF